MEDYKGKTAYITGAASGVGFGMAVAFAKEGMNVVMSDIRRDSLETAAEEVKKYTKGVYTIPVDVSDRDAMREAADEAEKAFGNGKSSDPIKYASRQDSSLIKTGLSWKCESKT